LNQNTDADKLSIVVAAFVVGGSIHVLRFWGGGVVVCCREKCKEEEEMREGERRVDHQVIN
jgi:hypothetical protein